MSLCVLSYVLFFFFKQKTAYEMRISDWSSDVCSSDLESLGRPQVPWRRLFGADAGYGAPRTTGSVPVAVLHGRIYLTHLAGKGAIHSIDLANPQQPVVHFADPDSALLGLVPAADGLYLQVQEGMRQRLLRLDRKSTRLNSSH